jgi:alpha-tubulin suppressor-like RCC1 family protein
MHKSLSISSRWLVPLAACALLLPLSGCQDEEATAPSVDNPAVSLATASAPLAFLQVSASEFQHTCGVTTDNRAYCWGRNTEGQLGIGTTTAGSSTPVPVAGTLRFRMISAGFDATCAVTTDFHAYCWGSNGRGELGDGTTTDRIRPTAVAGGLRFRTVATSFQHTCGLTYPDSRIFCWGWNSDGQLGDRSRTDRLRPVAIATTLTFKQVTAGYHHSCGLTGDGHLYCWGANHYGEAGTGSTDFRVFRPTLVAGTRLYRNVDAGRDYTCAATTGFRAFCWGYNGAGQLGNGGTASSRTPSAVAGGLSLERVTAGNFYACAEATNNKAWCWGGFNSSNRNPIAVPTTLLFSQLSAGGGHTCGRTPEAVAYCWGSGFEGQLGNGTKSNSATPVPVSGPA